MLDQGLGSWTARRARMTPHRVALRHGDAAITYAELHDRVRRAADALAARGVQAGDRVAYLGPNHPSLVEVLFAATSLGAVFVPVNWRLAAPEVAHVLGDADVTALVCAGSHAEVAAAALDGTDDVTVLVVDRGGAATGEWWEGYDEAVAAATPTPRDRPTGLDDVAVLLYTSGTTGRPKGAMLTHGNITWNAVNVVIDTDLAGDEVSLVCAPLFHVAALDMVLLPALMKGSTVILESGFDAGEVLATIERERVTCMFGVPTMFDRMAAHPDFATTDVSSLRRLLCGGAPVPLRTITTWLERDVVFMQGYGMTETAPGALFLGAERAAEKAGTAGVPSFFTDVRVVRPDGTDVDVGERGEVIVQGPNVMAGYWRRPEATAEVIRDGWFHSGDVAVIDDDGYVRIVDRIKDMIVSGGENIYPAEVEDVLFDHPDVVEVAVIGIPDPGWGEVGRAIVVRTPGSDLTGEALLAHAEGRLARYKIPKSVVFADELPRSGAGKVLKPILRDRFGEGADGGQPDPTA
ncbi:long-chain fatty acid--CoA ligase [Euzebya sp.]|uniref:acyl-CoA synthetase n=1 Tax=Euzebya sp. TaxID=1971409 RepID=UPI003514B5A2